MHTWAGRRKPRGLSSPTGERLPVVSVSPTAGRCLINREPRQRSGYCDWLWAGRTWGRSSSPVTVKNFLFSPLSRPALGSTQPPIQRVLEDLSLGVKRPGREANHSPPASAEVKKMWLYTSTPPYAFMA
jgi:hypothetical protein